MNRSDYSARSPSSTTTSSSKEDAHHPGKPKSPPGLPATPSTVNSDTSASAATKDTVHAHPHAVTSSTLQVMHQPSPSASRGAFAPFTRRSPSPSPAIAMGQVQSMGRGPSPSMPSSPSSAQKLKLSWPIRRKKTPDAQPSQPPPISHSCKARDPASYPMSPVSTSSSLSPTSSSYSDDQSTRSRSNRNSAKSFATNALQVMKGKFNASTTSVSSPSSPALEPQTPPPPPPKPINSRSSTSSQGGSSADHTSRSRNVSPLSLPDILPEDKKPSEPSTVTSRADATLPEVPHEEHATPAASSDLSAVGVCSKGATPRRRERRPEEQSTKDVADDWRKSDSTLRTVKVGVGNRTPRPLSLAESTHSGNTVTTPVGNAAKRSSTLIMDTDFGMPEVDSEDEDGDESIISHSNSMTSGAMASMESMHSFNKSGRSSFDSTYSANSSPRGSPTPGAISKLVKAARRGSNNFAGRFSPSPRRGEKATEDASLESDHEVAVSGSDSEFLSSASIDSIPSASSSTTSVTSTPSQSSKGTSSSALDAHRHPTMVRSADVASTHSGGTQDRTQGLHPWVSTEKESDKTPSLSASMTSLSLSAISAHSNSTTNSRDLVRLAKSPTSLSNILLPESPRKSSASSVHARGLRQTAVSFTSASAGFAKGFGRKAVDKLGKALSGSSVNPPTTMGFGMESAMPSSFHFSSSHSESPAQTSGGMSASSGSDHHDDHHRKKKHGLRRGRTPNAPSGTWSVASSDSEPVSTGPGLGYLVRPPTRPGQGGLLFGRPLFESVRDTAVKPGTIGVMSIKKYRGSLSSAEELEVVRNRALGDRRIPALVARCAQHIEKWGVQEEGLFRVSGRASHIAKMRVEFDAGADYDMTECGPSEIDPHAVASVLKAFLRELPEPLLTRQLTPYFEEALAQESSSRAQDQNLSNDSERGRLPQVRKAPSLSTFSVPTFALRAPSKSLVKAFASLIERLPQENRDLVRTVAELIRATALRSKETKMPLSNLLLVFCPSLAMSPPLLKVLCEADNIWEGALPDDVEEEAESKDLPDKPVEAHEPDLLAQQDGEERIGRDSVSTKSRHSDRRGRVATIYLPSSPRDGIVRESAIAEALSPARVQRDPSSDRQSTKKHSTPADGRSPVDPAQSHLQSLSPYSPPPLTSSSESLSTPASSSIEDRSQQEHEYDVQPGTAKSQVTVRSQSDLPSPRKVRKGSIGTPVVFPAAPGGSVPVTPIEIHAPLRLSSYSSSSPDLHPDMASRRKSKISFTDLLPKTKRSLSSLIGRSPTTPESIASFTPPDTRINISSTPPVIDFNLEQSPIKMGGLGLDFTDVDEKERSHTLQVPEISHAVGAERMQSATSTNSSSSGVFYTPPTSTRTLTHTASLASFSSTGSYSLLEEFGFDKDIRVGDEGDWASSVLKAATDGGG